MKLIRLSTGEEVIAKILEEDECTMTIEDGVMLMPAGEGKIGFVPFMPYSTGEPVVLRQNHIMFITEPNAYLANQVRQMVSGIEVPSQSIIT